MCSTSPWNVANIINQYILYHQSSLLPDNYCFDVVAVAVVVPHGVHQHQSDCLCVNTVNRIQAIRFLGAAHLFFY
jgi:hypothetical protein